MFWMVSIFLNGFLKGGVIVFSRFLECFYLGLDWRFLQVCLWFHGVLCGFYCVF